MTDRHMALTPLTEEEWPLVRDITMALDQADQSYMVNEVNLRSAVCFIGEPHARRLWDDTSSTSMSRLMDLFNKCDQWIQLGRRRFRIEQDGLAFRAQLGENANGQDLTLRALPEETPSLHDLQLPDAWRALMLDQSLLNGGLLLIVAPNGQGKTTTASSIVRSRLETFGGFANTIEDPVELPLQGPWGKGICMQRPALDARTMAGGDRNAADLGPGEGYYLAMIDALRQFPAITGGGTILFVGEIGDAQTAAETLKAAANGHLVVATLHAKSIPAALRRMVTLCAGSRDAMDVETVRELVADSLRGVFAQRLVWSSQGEGWQRAQIKGDLLWLDHHDSQVAKTIRSGRFDDLYKISREQTTEVNQFDGKANVNGTVVKAMLKATAGAPNRG